jgi:UPF0755 protein
MKKKSILILTSATILVLLVLLGRLYFSTQGNFASQEKIIYLYEDSTPEQAMQVLEKDSIISDRSTFDMLIRLKNVERFKSGRYKITNGIRTNQLINMFRAGLQSPILVKVDGVRDIYNLAGSLSKQLKHDSTEFINAILDQKILSEHKLKPEEAISLILPNTYELFWNVSPEKFMDRMIQISTNYWSRENIDKANKLNLSISEVYTLASIVKGETIKKEEASKIAGLYLNRLRMGMPLEADPTITFALNLKKAQRVYFNDLKVNSAYNTYKNKGLPPGPIFMVEPHFLDAVLNAEDHNYIFMCAQPGRTGLHNFSTNFSQHNVYAALYRKWLNENNIR